jgi:hypothetical protein
VGDPLRKPLWRIGWEGYSYRRAKGSDLTRYFESYAYRIGAPPARGFMTTAEYWTLRAWIEQGREEEGVRFGDKLLFHRLLHEREGIRLPTLLGWVEEGVAYRPGDEPIPLRELDDATRTFGAMLRAAQAEGSDAAFAKPREEHCGIGVHRVTKATEGAALFDTLRKRDYIIQAAVRQHPALRALYPHALNTLRMNTCLPADGIPRLVTAVLRCGQGGAVVDNGAQGGFYGGIDLPTGRVRVPCVTPFKTGCSAYTHHPDTSHPLDGFEVPFFREAVEMTLRAAALLPYPFVGWDVGIAEDGPVLIEGNHTPDYHGDELVNGGYLLHPVIGPFIEEVTEGWGLRHRPPSEPEPVQETSSLPPPCDPQQRQERRRRGTPTA